MVYCARGDMEVAIADDLAANFDLRDKFVMTNNQDYRSNARHMTSEDRGDRSVLALGDILSASDTSDFDTDALRWFHAGDAESLALAIGAGQTAPGSEFAYEAQESLRNLPNGGGSRADQGEGPAGEQSRRTTSGGLGTEAAAEGSAVSGSATGVSVTIANGATVEIDGPSAQSVTFAGTMGTVMLGDPQAFTGVISGLAATDAIDLSGFAYGANTTATYLGNASGGTLTVTDGAKAARIALSGNYLSSTWTLSSDGKGGTVVVDPTTSANWQTLKVGAGGYATALDIAPDGTMVAVAAARHGVEHARSLRFQRPRRLRDPDGPKQFKHHVYDV
jgi:hypothetical protein